MKDKNIEELTLLTQEQESMVNEMRELYLKMQKAGISFVLNGDSRVAVYNGLHIADCQYQDETGDMECVEIENMENVFPLWAFGELYVRRE